MATRALTKAENEVLDSIEAKIQNIVDTGMPARLTATRVLGDPAANQQAYGQFSHRFGQLDRQLTQLRNKGKVVVNPELDPSMWANTPIPDTDDATEVDGVQVRDELVAQNSATPLVLRAVKLMHELSHTIYQQPDFTVKDFTYMKSWGQGYLPGAVSACNADTYAEAAAQIAEDIERQPGRFREVTQIPAQRRVLHGLQPALILGPALAWADIKVNRAWLRSLNYITFAEKTAGASRWQETADEWAAARGNNARLLQIEAGLRDPNMGRIIGNRYGALTIGLSDESKLTAKNIGAYMLSLKQALGRLELNLSDRAGAITYAPATDVLDVPRQLVTGTSSALGELIVDALLGALDYADATDRSTANLNAHKRAVIDLLVGQDRPYEAGQIATVLQVFQGIQSAAPPAQAAWDSAKVDLDLATVQSIADRLKVMMYNAEEAARPASPLHEHLRTLDQLLQPLVDKAIQIGHRYTGPGVPVLSAAQDQARKDIFNAAIQALNLIYAAASPYAPGQAATYDGWLASLRPFAA